MALEFYLFSGSPFAWRVHLALEVKELSYNIHFLSLSHGDHKLPEFLKLNPRGRVPVITDGNTKLYESVAILAYLEVLQPTLPLFGSSPSETGHIWQRVQEMENYARNPFLRVAIEIFNGEIEQKWNELNELLALCREQLDWVEGILSSSHWIAGVEASAADLVFYPVVKIFLRATSRPEAEKLGMGMDIFAKQYSASNRWIAQVETLRGYSNTYPPHWTE